MVLKNMATISGKTTANPYVSNVPDINSDSGVESRYQVTPLLTVGDEVPLLEGDFGDFTSSEEQTFAMTGIPDGLGIYETEDSYFVWMNHEFASTEEVENPATGGGSSSSNQGDVPPTDVIEVPIVSPISSTVDGQIQGARVSLFQFDKDWNAVGGKNLIETVVDNTGTYELDLDTGEYVSTSDSEATLSFSRFCSGYLADSGFEGGPVWFAPEESGSESRGWAVTPDGTAQAIEGLGRYSKENVVSASQYRAEDSDKTVLLATEDYADGELYMYVGQQTEEDPNGFTNGDLYALKVEGYDFETIPEDEAQTATWTKVPGDIALNPDGTVLGDWVNAEGRSTNFQRIEDIAEDPNNPGTFYYVTTGTEEKPGGDVGDDSDDATTPEEAANPYGKLYRLSLNPDDPTGEIDDFEMVLKGGPDTGVSYDNVTVDGNGNVLIQEDETAFGGDVMKAENRDAGIWSYNIASDKDTFVFELDENAAGAQFNDPEEPGEWESSGIIEVDSDARPGESSYLFDVQAHSVTDPEVLGGEYVEGGQLILAQPGGKTQFGTLEADDLTAYQDDIVFGGDGDDFLDASSGQGNNRLYGGAGDDYLFAGSNDRLIGGNGSDRLFVRSGGDNLLTGGEGSDQFWIATGELPEEANTITDFESGMDVIGIGGLGVSFDDLSLTQDGSNAVVAALGQDLAILNNVQTSALGDADFDLA